MSTSPEVLTRSLQGQILPECCPLVGLSFAKVPASYLLWWRCMAEWWVYSSVALIDAY